LPPVDRSLLVGAEPIFKGDVGVRSIAERLVLRCAAPAKCDTVPLLVFEPVGSSEHECFPAPKSDRCNFLLDLRRARWMAPAWARRTRPTRRHARQASQMDSCLLRAGRCCEPRHRLSFRSVSRSFPRCHKPRERAQGPVVIEHHLEHHCRPTRHLGLACETFSRGRLRALESDTSVRSIAERSR
jgi:hypothetical protein